MAYSYDLTLFEVPEEQQKKLSFCATECEDFEQWLYNIFNQADLVATAKAVYLALEEIACLKRKDRLRLELLALIRPRVHELVLALEQQHALLAGQRQKKAEALAELKLLLQAKLAQTYSVIAVNASKEMGRLFTRSSYQLGQSILAALEEMRACVLLYYQQYQAVPEKTWLQIYHLYLIAAHFGLDSQQQPILSAYKHLLLWGCVNAHQLHADDMVKIDQLFLLWRTRVQLNETGYDDYGMFFIILNRDAAPIAKKFYQAELGKVGQSLDFSSLVNYLRQPEASSDLRQLDLPERLLAMFLYAWGGTNDRTFERKSRQQAIQIALGLSASHYFINKQQPLTALIGREALAAGQHATKAQFAPQRPLKDRLDIWAGGGYRSDAQMQEGAVEFKSSDSQTELLEATSTTAYNYQEATLLDVSPSGYKIEYRGESDHSLSVGNLLAVKEAHHTSCDLAIIRWLKQSSSQTTLIGLELFQPNILAGAIAHCSRNAEVSSNYMPAFLLPLSNTEFEHEDSIIAPVNMFKVGQYFVLITALGKIYAQVNKVIVNNNFCQFSYLESAPFTLPKEEVLQDDKVSNPFISTWEIL